MATTKGGFTPCIWTETPYFTVLRAIFPDMVISSITISTTNPVCSTCKQ